VASIFKAKSSTTAGLMLTKTIPHFGHLPFVLLRTSGCIGQVYSASSAASACGLAAVAACLSLAFCCSLAAAGLTVALLFLAFGLAVFCTAAMPICKWADRKK